MNIHLKHRADVGKASVYAIVINAIQIALILVIVGVVFFGPQDLVDRRSVRILLLISATIVIWGAVLDIQDAFTTRKMHREMNQLDSLMDGMEKMNYTLRAQRHDFLNHLQVVYSLMEMKEYEEANAYIEKVYGAISSVSAMLKTASPAVNALLQVKTGACEKKGIRLVTEIRSSWRDLPLEGWEACKVLGNLIDNAMDALSEAGTQAPLIQVTLTEDIHAYRFRVSNNGPEIPESVKENIFRPGITSKADGHGMGLYIVSGVIKKAGGEITLESNEKETAFAGSFPKHELPSSDQPASEV